MAKRVITLVLVACFLLAMILLQPALNRTGFAVNMPPDQVGPTLDEQNCMKSCVSISCADDNMSCKMANGERCQKECNVIKPESSSPEISCMEVCVAKGCDSYDFTCQDKNKDSCEKECNMIKEPEAKSEEEKCIRECVNAESPGLICQAGEGGEKGNEICQRCAKSCEHLYAGPCLGDNELKQKQKECETCEHCYGEPVKGDSGEGYECIVDIKCSDASGEFGDEPGEGPGILGKAVDAVSNFFKNLFGVSDSNSEGQVQE